MSSIPLDWFWDPRLRLWSLWASHSSLGSCHLYRTPNTQGAGTEYSFYTCNIEVIVEMPSLSYQDIHGPPQDSECFSLRGTSRSPSFLGLAHFKESAALKSRAFLSEQFELLRSLPSHLLVCHHHFKVILFSSMNNYLFLLFPPHMSTFSVLCGSSDPQPWRHTWMFQQKCKGPFTTSTTKKSKLHRAQLTLFLKRFRQVYLRWSLAISVLTGYDWTATLVESHSCFGKEEGWAIESPYLFIWRKENERQISSQQIKTNSKYLFRIIRPSKWVFRYPNM